MKNCRNCGVDMSHRHPNAINCLDCSILLRKARKKKETEATHVPETANCVVCGTQYKPRTLKSKTCSKDCRNYRRNASRRKSVIGNDWEQKPIKKSKGIPCIWCDTKFMPQNQHDKTCKAECRMAFKAYKNKMNKLYDAAYPADDRKTYPPYPVKDCDRPLGMIPECSGKYLPTHHKQTTCPICIRAKSQNIG